MNDVFHKIEEAITGPVKILKDEDARRLQGESFNQHPPGMKDTLAILCVLRDFAIDAQHRKDYIGKTGSVLLLIVCPGEDCFNLGERDIGTKETGEKAAQGPVGKRLTVRGTADDGSLEAVIRIKAFEEFL
jgi:hypothetical protein